MTRYVWIPLTVSFLIGCGGGGNGNNGTDTRSSDREIVTLPEQTYTVYRGDKVIKNTPDAKVRISHTLGSPETTVTLLDGEAVILRR